ncbi:GNAT family protein [Paraclostridium bifermentans]|nr:GNAT family protein [Paraclostridium bifermentans]
MGDKDNWGNGYGKEALSLLLDFGFNLLNLNNIVLKVYSFNKQAIKCYSKIGFKEAGRLREAKDYWLQQI